MPPIKPNFPNPTVQDLKANLDKLGHIISDSTMADGTIDIGVVSRKIEQSNNPGMERGLGAITDAYQRTEMRDVRVGCSGTERRRVQVDPAELKADEVQSVIQAIILAKGKLETIDTNHNGKISESEHAAAGTNSLVEKLAEGAIYGSLASYKVELRKWNEELSVVHRSVDRRQNFNSRLQEIANEHAETPQGAEAILWAFRELATRGQGSDVWSVKERLHDAETSWLRFIPFFGKMLARGPGHLSDKEIASHFRVDSLSALIDSKKAAIEGRLNGTFEAVYLSGKDLPGADQLSDPDFVPSRTSC